MTLSLQARAECPVVSDTLGVKSFEQLVGGLCEVPDGPSDEIDLSTLSKEDSQKVEREIVAKLKMVSRLGREITADKCKVRLTGTKSGTYKENPQSVQLRKKFKVP